MAKKAYFVGLRLDRADKDRLDDLMVLYGRDQADLLRWLIREEHKRGRVGQIAHAPVVGAEDLD